MAEKSPFPKTFYFGPDGRINDKMTNADCENWIKFVEEGLAKSRVEDDSDKNLDSVIYQLVIIAQLQCHIGKLYETIPTYKELLDKVLVKCCTRPNVENYEYAADIHEEAIGLLKDTHQHDLVIKTMLKHAQFLSKLKKYDQAISILKQVSNCGNSRLTGKANVELKKIFFKNQECQRK
jgi:tetratricopeptide (TPR) repeat protein